MKKKYGNKIIDDPLHELFHKVKNCPRVLISRIHVQIASVRGSVHISYLTGILLHLKVTHIRARI